jgi:hypothetical protein
VTQAVNNIALKTDIFLITLSKLFNGFRPDVD